MSPFTLHRNYRIRRTHVADIKERLVRAVYYHRRAQQCRAGAGQFSSDPEARESFDFWMDEASCADRRCEAILADIRSDRELERMVDAHRVASEPAVVSDASQLERLSEGYDIPGIITSERLAS